MPAASLGLVSAASSAVSPLFIFSWKNWRLFFAHRCHFYWFHSGVTPWRVSPCTFLPVRPCSSTIGGFNQRQGEALPPQTFSTLKFVVWAKLHNDDVLFLQWRNEHENSKNGLSTIHCKFTHIFFRSGVTPLEGVTRGAPLVTPLYLASLGRAQWRLDHTFPSQLFHCLLVMLRIPETASLEQRGRR